MSHNNPSGVIPHHINDSMAQTTDLSNHSDNAKLTTSPCPQGFPPPPPPLQVCLPDMGPALWESGPGENHARQENPPQMALRDNVTMIRLTNDKIIASKSYHESHPNPRPTVWLQRSSPAMRQRLSLATTHRFSPPSYTFCPSISPLPTLKSPAIANPTALHSTADATSARLADSDSLIQ